MSKFNKQFDISMYFGEITPIRKDDIIVGSKIITCDFNEMKRQIDVAKLHCCKNIIIPIHMDLDNNNNMYFAENLDTVKQGISYANSIGINTDVIKVHYQTPWDSDRFFGLSNNKSLEPFIDKYKEAIKVLCEKFKGCFDKFVIATEFAALYRTICWNHYDRDKFIDYTYKNKELIELVRSYGFKAGISCCGVNDASKVPSELLESLDFLGVNWYPDSDKNDLYDYLSDVKDKYSKDIEWFKSYKEKYGKPLYITETGIEDWYASKEHSCIVCKHDGEEFHGGKIQALNLEMLFNLYNEIDVDMFCYWYMLFNNKPTIDMCNKYVGDLEWE